MKTEIWNGHLIRFVEVNGEWCGIAKDIADALDYRDANSMTKKFKTKYLVYAKMADMNQKYLALTEFGIYKAIFGSHKKEADDFQEWAFNVIKRLREASNLQGYQVFRLLDKEHQKQTMAMLSHSLTDPKRQDFIKANTIANKAVSNRFGYPKMVKKDSMTPDMLNDREPILEATAHLIADKRNFDLDIHVSEVIYRKFPVKEDSR
ncbi:MAG: BRO family protein [Schleiferilactobacillus perolens]|uniref:BRO-N domain-containing protein n=1 Tax=Schleiferilactobacillus perolens TaxID=100468 RepID=UPI0039E77569